MKVSIASDHAGVILKDKIVKHLQKLNISVADFGPFGLDAVDYPCFAKKVTTSITNHETDLGILICGSGIGMSIAANKVKGIRCALVYSEETVKLAREHNHVNCIAIGQRLTDHDLAVKMVDVFLTTPIAERHNQRVAMLDEMGCDDECECS